MASADESHARWRTNQFAVTFASFISFMGFTLVMPFLPLYFHQLGVVGDEQIALWSGLSLGVTPALTALFSPIWGRLADRFGRKIMLERSIGSFVVVMGAMAYVTEPWHVFGLRVVQGLFAGFGALTLAMAVESARPDRVAPAIGLVQTAQRLGPALGPVFGGTIAQLVGLRRAFVVAAGFYAIAFVVVLFLYHEETAGPASRTGDSKPRVTLRSIAALPNFILLFVVVFTVQFVDRSYGPILPLLVAQLGTPVARVPLVAGLLFSSAAACGAIGHHLAGILLVKRQAKRVIVGGATLAIVALGVVIATASIQGLFVAAPLLGLGVGLQMTAGYAAASHVMPKGIEATAFGLLASASLAGLAVSPVLSGLLAAMHIRAVFVVDAIVLAILVVVVERMMVAAESARAA